MVLAPVRLGAVHVHGGDAATRSGGIFWPWKTKSSRRGSRNSTRRAANANTPTSPPWPGAPPRELRARREPPRARRIRRRPRSGPRPSVGSGGPATTSSSTSPRSHYCCSSSRSTITAARTSIRRSGARCSPPGPRASARCRPRCCGTSTTPSSNCSACRAKPRARGGLTQPVGHVLRGERSRTAVAPARGRRTLTTATAAARPSQVCKAALA